MLCEMAFQVSTTVVALHLDASIAKAYFCNQDSIASFFLSRLACHILNLTDKHGFTFILAYIPTHLNVEADHFSWSWLVPEWHVFACIA